MPLQETILKLAQINPTTTPFFSIYLNTLKPRGKKSSGEVFLRKMILEFENFGAVVWHPRQAKIFPIGLGKIVETKILEKEEFVDVRLKEKLGRYKVYKNKLERKLDLYIENFVEEVPKSYKSFWNIWVPAEK